MVSTPQVTALHSRGIPPAWLHRGWKTLALLLLISWLYAPILVRLVRQWWIDPNFSHGFCVPPFCAFVVWHSRARLAGVVRDPSVWGLVILLTAMFLLTVGVLGADIFLCRVSFVVLVAGLVVFFLGWSFFKAVLFPWALLFLMVPVPAIIFEQITFPLQLLASKMAASALFVLGVPVLREGNIIRLPNISLEVAQACSGIRSLLSLVTLATMYGFFVERRTLVRLLLSLAAVPIAVAANCLRIVGTGLLAHYWDPVIADGFLHTFSGVLIFAVSLVALASLHQVLRAYPFDGRQAA